MPSKRYTDELNRALARPDAEKLIKQTDAYIADCPDGVGVGEWPEDRADDFSEILMSPDDDPDKALAYVVLAASRTDDVGFLGMFAAGPLEDLLRDPSDEMLARVVAQARKSARFRWMLSISYQIALAARAWTAIEKFRIDPDNLALPPSD